MMFEYVHAHYKAYTKVVGHSLATINVSTITDADGLSAEFRTWSPFSILRNLAKQQL